MKGLGELCVNENIKVWTNDKMKLKFAIKNRNNEILKHYTLEKIFECVDNDTEMLNNIFTLYNISDYYCMYLIRHASIKGDLNMVKYIVNRNRIIDNTALMKASVYKNYEIVEYLIQNGANSQLIKNKTCLSYLTFLDKMRIKKVITIQRWWRRHR